jgi:hypothetical protein
MNRIASIALVLISLSTVAAADTSSPTAIKNDYSTLCNSPELSGATKEKIASERPVKIANYLRTHLKTPEVQAFFRKLGDGSIAPDQIGPTIKRAAAAAGYQGKCPAAEPTK